MMSGCAYMAIKAQVPLVPLTLIGTYELLPIHVYALTRAPSPSSSAIPSPPPASPPATPTPSPSASTRPSQPPTCNTTQTTHRTKEGLNGND